VRTRATAVGVGDVARHGPMSRQAGPSEKQVATWAAVAAMNGYQLTRLPDGDFLIARWDRSMEADAAGVERFLARVEGRA
jgi:hypothetical protein